MSYKRVNETHINVDEIVTVRDLLNIVKRICIDNNNDKESLLKSKVVFINSIQEIIEIPDLIDDIFSKEQKEETEIFNFDEKIDVSNDLDLDI